MKHYKNTFPIYIFIIYYQWKSKMILGQILLSQYIIFFLTIIIGAAGSYNCYPCVKNGLFAVICLHVHHLLLRHLCGLRSDHLQHME